MKLLKSKLFKSAKNIKNKIENHITTYTYTYKFLATDCHRSYDKNC